MSELLAQAAEARLDAFLVRRGITRSSIDVYLRLWRQVNVGAFDGRAYLLPETAATAMQTYMRTLIERGLSPVTVRNHLAMARYFFEAHDAPTLLADVRTPVRIVKKLTQSLLDDEVERLFAALHKVDKRAKVLFEIILLTGLRLSELLELHFSADDLAAQRLLVKTPAGHKRAVFIGTQAQALLEGFLGKRRLPRGEQARLRLTQSLRRAASAAGLEGVTPSRIRMTYAIRMLIDEHPLDFVTKNLGLDKGSPNSRRRIRQVLVNHHERRQQRAHE